MSRNLSLSLDANARAHRSDASSRTSTVNRRAVGKSSSVVECRLMEHRTRGGSAETAPNALTVRPGGRQAASMLATRVTPEGYPAIRSLNNWGWTEADVRV